VRHLILAHGSGLDELVMFLFPLIAGGGAWVLTRQQPKPRDKKS
jgi:hypothetical protein